jgi:ThiF family/Prokaryotic homologs of the JAB domain
MTTRFRMTGRQHGSLNQHVFPGDGMEAVSIGICGRHHGERNHTLTLRQIVHIPHSECRRTGASVSWSTRLLEELLTKSMDRDVAIVKFHSHPGGYERFSDTDDRADADLFDSVHGWTNSEGPHASVVVLPDGSMFGRAIFPDGRFEQIRRIAVVGDDLKFFDDAGATLLPHPAFDRQVRLFGEATTTLLGSLSVGVIGCSGTGGPVIEMLGRLGVSRLVIVDPDRIGIENLPRIPGSTAMDVKASALKVDVLARSVRAMGLGTEVVSFATNIAEDPAAVRALADVDVLIGCVDSVEGRHVANRLAAFYNLPYFDVGIKLIADQCGTIEQVCGTVHFLQPDGSSLFDRKVYTMAQLEAEALKRSDPITYAERRREKYISGVDETRPAVVTVNTQFAAILVNEVLARLHPYRLGGNGEYAVVRHSLSQMETYYESEADQNGQLFAHHFGRGDVQPLLDMPELSEGKGAA